MKPWFFFFKTVGSIKEQCVEVDIEIKASPEALDEGYSARMARNTQLFLRSEAGMC